MLSKSLEKYVNSLRTKKQRYAEQRYILEGEKVISELLHYKESIVNLLALETWVEENYELLKGLERKIVVCDERETDRISEMKNSPKVLAIAAFPQRLPVKHTTLSLLIDDLQDPGNMGTIIRAADWFGLDAVYISTNSVDPFNPKTVQASMGSILHVPVIEINLPELIKNHANIALYGAEIGGTSLMQVKKERPAFVVIGNEGHGLSEEVTSLIKNKISIPRKGRAESLNAAMAASIICALWME
jgi:RNA methyltransferase, TrmH family